MEFFNSYDEINNLPDSNGVYFYPTFGSVLAPFWSDKMTGAFVGLGLHSGKPNMLRAALDSICFRVYDNISVSELPKI